VSTNDTTQPNGHVDWSGNPQTPEGFETLHKWLYRGALFFFICLAVDGFIFFPVFMIKFGWH
jgi:hypothetical protein